MSFLRRIMLGCIATTISLGATPPASAAVWIFSPNGNWAASIDNEGGDAGRVLETQRLHISFPFGSDLRESGHYVRLGSSLTFGAATTMRMDDESFHLVSFTFDDFSYTAVLAANDFPGVLAVVHGEMTDGLDAEWIHEGGIHVSVSFVDLDAPLINPAPTRVKPFVYVDCDAAGYVEENQAFWLTNHFEQTHSNYWKCWFQANAPTSYAAQSTWSLKDLLDQGITELTPSPSASGGNVNTAVSFAEANLHAGGMHTISYAIGNQFLGLPSTFGQPPATGTSSISSPDGRWSASIRTGAGSTGIGSAGEISSVHDFDQPLATALFCNETRYYLAQDVGGVLGNQSLRDSFQRLAFYTSSDSPNSFTAVLSSQEGSGLLAVINGMMVDGMNGGIVVCAEFIDIKNQNLTIKPLVYADLNVDNNVSNTGQFQINRFKQFGPNNGTQRWFTSPEFEDYMSMEKSITLQWLENGHAYLNNTAVAGPINIAAAFGMHTLQLVGDEPYVCGFAIGNPVIQIPEWFCDPSVPPPAPVCPADIAPVGAPDGMVNVQDLLAVIGAWGPCGDPNNCAADIAPSGPPMGDGIANVQDLLAVIGAWGACP